jgi:hypothetical protein
VARAGLYRFYDETSNPPLPYVQRSHGNSDSRTGEKCSTYSWTVHEMRLRLSVGYHSIVGDLRPCRCRLKILAVATSERIRQG